MEKKVSLNIYELIKLLEEIEVKDLSITLFYELNNKIELLKEWLYLEIIYPRRYFLLDRN